MKLSGKRNAAIRAQAASLGAKAREWGARSSHARHIEAEAARLLRAAFSQPGVVNALGLLTPVERGGLAVDVWPIYAGERASDVLAEVTGSTPPTRH